MDRLFFSPSFYVMISVKYDIFHMISVRLLECLTPIMWKMDVMSVGEGPLSKKGATFRKLFTTILGSAFQKRDGNRGEKLIIIYKGRGYL